MTLSEMLVILVMHQKWKNLLLIDANSKAIPNVLETLSNSGIPVASLDLPYIEKYPWPEKMDFRPKFDGFVLIVGQQQATEVLKGVLTTLKQKFMVNPHQSWIIGVEGCLSISSIISLFDEGDKVLLIGSLITEHQKCKFLTMFQDFKVWSLHSAGNGSIYFIEKGQLSTSNGSEYLEEALFDEPFINFGGRVLKISSLGSPPVQEPPLPGCKKWRGYVFHIVNTLGDLFNFTYVVKEADGRLYGMEQEDGSWSGMMGELANKSVDMGVGDLSWTLDRSKASDLTNTIFPETVTFIYRAPDFYSRTWILFQDIDFRIWISLCSIMTVASLSYCLTLYVAEATDNCNKDSGVIFVEAAVRSVGSLYRAFLGQGIEHQPKWWSCRTLLGTWFLGALVLSALYGGSLTSTLSLHRTPSPADTLSGLVKRHPNVILALRNNSHVHSIFKTSTYWHNLYEKNIKNNVIPGKHHIEDTMVEVHKKVPKGSPIYAWIGERSMLVKQMHIYSDDRSVCDLYVAKDSIVRSDWALALVRNSPFLNQFNDKILRLQRFGLLQKWHSDHWQSGSGDCRPTDGRNPTGRNPISVADTQASFFILSVGWAAGFVVLFLEKWVHERTRKKISSTTKRMRLS